MLIDLSTVQFSDFVENEEKRAYFFTVQKEYLDESGLSFVPDPGVPGEIICGTIMLECSDDNIVTLTMSPTVENQEGTHDINHTDLIPGVHYTEETIDSLLRLAHESLAMGD